MGKESVVSVGTFDGVHRGHQLVVRTLREEAERLGARPLVVTFDRHPLEVIRPGAAPRLIMEPDRRDRLLRAEGAEVAVIPFTEEVRRISVADWMRILRDDHGARAIVLGYDNTFGSDGIDMNFDDYRRIGASLGIGVTVAPMVKGCSSSAIRKALEAGDIEAASVMLGRDYTLTGTVVKGRGLGRTIGFPTANVAPAPRLAVPGSGVYAAMLSLVGDDGRSVGKEMPAVVNIGNCPTIAAGLPRTIEAHIVDGVHDLYGKRVQLRFLGKIRNEKKFDSLDALKRGIAADIRALSAIMR